MSANTVIFLRLGSLFLSSGLVFPDFLSHLRRPAAEFIHPLADQRIQLLPQSPDFVNVVAFNQAANQCRDFIGHGNISPNGGSRHFSGPMPFSRSGKVCRTSTFAIRFKTKAQMPLSYRHSCIFRGGEIGATLFLVDGSVLRPCIVYNHPKNTSWAWATLKLAPSAAVAPWSTRNHGLSATC